MSLKAARGVARLARFDASGLDAFDATPQGLVNALTPWLAFSLAGCALVAIAGDVGRAVSDLLASVAALLTPPVLSHALAGLLGRRPLWLRYAVAVVWCQWVMPPALLLALTGSFLLMSIGVPQDPAERLAMLALLAYALCLNVFLTRKALNLGWWRAIAVVAAVNITTGAAVVLPGVIAMMQEIGR